MSFKKKHPVPMTINPIGLYTVHDISDYFGVSYRTALNLIANYDKSKTKIKKVGKSIRLTGKDLLDLYESLPDYEPGRKQTVEGEDWLD